MLRGGADGFGGAGGGVRGVLGPQLPGWLQQAAAQVLELAQPGGGDGESAPAAGCAVEHGPGDADTTGFTREAADNLCAAACFAEGAFDEMRVPDAGDVRAGTVDKRSGPRDRSARSSSLRGR